MSSQTFLEKQKVKLEKQLTILWSQVNYCEDIESSSEALEDYLIKMKAIYMEYTGNDHYITLMAEKTKQHIDEQLNLFLDGLNKMIQLREKYSEINSTILTLNKENEEVDKNMEQTLKLLREVSSQTNILAINANIEAYRLGPKGDVFKIIATEVRKLSDITSNASVNMTNTTNKLTKQTSDMTQILNENNQTLFQVVQELEKGKESFISMYTDSENIVTESMVLDDTLKTIYDLIQKVYTMVEYNKMSYSNVKRILLQQVELTKEMIDDINQELGVSANFTSYKGAIDLYQEFYKNFKSENLEHCLTIIHHALDNGEDAEFITTQILERTVESIGREQIDRLVPLSEIYVNGRIIEACLDVLLPLLEKDQKGKKLGKIIIGNAFGDYHALGRQIISTFLRMAGFDVVDLGLSVSNETFVEVVRKEKANLICVSALILHIAEEVIHLRELLDKKGLRHVKILVGGAPFNFDPRLVQRVKADAMAQNGIEAIKTAKELLGLLHKRVVK